MVGKRSISSFTRTEIDQLFKDARRVVRVPGLEIRIAPASQDQGRILLTVPRAVGNAPKRNKIKRRIRSIFREHHLAERGLDAIVLVRREANDLSFTQLEELMLRAFQQKKENR